MVSSAARASLAESRASAASMARMGELGRERGAIGQTRQGLLGGLYCAARILANLLEALQLRLSVAKPAARSAATRAALAAASWARISAASVSRETREAVRADSLAAAASFCAVA